MSRIGKKTILIPEGTEISWTSSSVSVKGPHGELTKQLALSGFKLLKKNKELKVLPPVRLGKETRSMWGTIVSVIFNMIQGVNQPFEKVLEFEGIGYKAEISQGQLVLGLGFSHPVRIEVPQNLTVSVNSGQIVISGIDKELVGNFAASIRKLRPVEPYKGTGIRYKGEVVKRKAGKKLAGTGV